jgi:hypothetical protein
MAKQQPTPEQLAALKKWAAQYGRTWKSKLRLAWYGGGYGDFDGDSGPLQQIRNTLGPTWLIGFRIQAD